MRRPALTRIGIVVAGAAVALVLFLVLRPGEDDPGARTAAVPTATAPEIEPGTTAETGTETGSETATEAETETDPAETETAADEGPATIRILVQDGAVRGGVERVRVQQGERVRLVVRADVADHVHLHGYDVMRNVGPGRPAQLAFEASIPGRFEVELEDSRLPIAEIEVRP